MGPDNKEYLMLINNLKARIEDKEHKCEYCTYVQRFIVQMACSNITILISFPSSDKVVIPFNHFNGEVVKC